MYHVPNEPHGEPRTPLTFLRDLSALGLAIAILAFGMMDSILLGSVLGPFVTLAGLIVVIALCVTLAKRYGESKRLGKAQVRRVWLTMWGVALVLIALAYLLGADPVVP